MISASEINKKVYKAKEEHRANELIKITEQQKIKNDRINSELLEVEKAINEFDKSITKKTINPELARYISVPIVVSNDVKAILEEQGYFVTLHFTVRNSETEKIGTRLYFNERNYNKDLYKHNISSIDKNRMKAYESLTNSCITEKSPNQEWGYKPATEDEKVDKMSNLSKSAQKFKEDNPVYNFSIKYMEDTNRAVKEIRQEKEKFIQLKSRLKAKECELKSTDIIIDSLDYTIENRDKILHRHFEKFKIQKEINELKLSIREIEFKNQLKEQTNIEPIFIGMGDFENKLKKSNSYCLTCDISVEDMGKAIKEITQLLDSNMNKIKNEIQTSLQKSEQEYKQKRDEQKEVLEHEILKDLIERQNRCCDRARLTRRGDFK